MKTFDNNYMNWELLYLLLCFIFCENSQHETIPLIISY